MDFPSLESKEADKTSQQDKLPLFLRGFKQCISDATRFFQDVEELDVSEGRCYRLIQHLKRQISKYENKECDLTRAGMEDRVVWDTEEAKNISKRRSSLGRDTLGLRIFDHRISQFSFSPF
jgi:hypothetical protein